MTNPFNQFRQKHLAALLVLAMLGASLHIFAHLRDHIESHPVCEITQRDNSHHSGKSVYNTIHACSGCESLDHSVAASTAVTFTPAFEKLDVDVARQLRIVSTTVIGNLSSRAPPLL